MLDNHLSAQCVYPATRNAAVLSLPPEPTNLVAHPYCGLATPELSVTASATLLVWGKNYRYLEPNVLFYAVPTVSTLCISACLPREER